MVGLLNAAKDFLLKIGPGGNALLVKPGGFALDLEGFIQLSGKGRVGARIGDKHVQGGGRGQSQAFGNKVYLEGGGLVLRSRLGQL